MINPSKMIRVALLTLLMPTAVNANLTEQREQLKSITEYHATIIGAALSCNFEREKIKLIHKQFTMLVDDIPMSLKEKETISNLFLDSIKKHSKKEYSQSDCKQFSKEFEKIYNAISKNK